MPKPKFLAGSEYSSDSDANYEELESMLNEPLPEELKNKKKEYEERFKIIMEGMYLILYFFIKIF